MKKKIKSALIGLLVSVCSVGIVQAEDITETDVQEEKDIEDMSIEELRVAYLKLQVKYNELQLQMAQEANSDTTESETETSTEAETDSEEQVARTTEEFLSDILQSYSDRQIVSSRYTNAEINTMTNQESYEYLNNCAEAERDFYNKYKNAVFDDLNIQYLCGQYIDGLTKQYDSYKQFLSGTDYDDAYSIYNSGYYDRAYVIVELSDYYNVDFPADAIASMKANTESMDSLNDAETRNASVDSETSRGCQELLNEIGFYCGNADGIPGKRTVKSIKRFQEMYGYEPVDGIIDDELISQLKDALEQKQDAETEAVTEQ